MKYLLIALSLFALNAEASKEVTIKDNGRISVRENGIKKDLGTVRKVKETNKGTEIYTNRNYNGPSVTISKRKEIYVSSSTEATSSSSSYVCKYGCRDESEESGDE